MKWQGRRGSRNIEDRRTQGGRAQGGRGAAAGGIGGVGLLVVLALGYFLGIDVTPLLDGGGAPVQQEQARLTEAEQRMGDFVSVTLADTEEVWAGIFASQLRQTYREPTLVLFSGATRSACGMATAATGPFYCPPENRIFLDTDFFVTMERQLGAGGDFAFAYVVAHEVAHHVQNELGILDQANAERARGTEAQSNAISVRIELQADCFAGIWARAAERQFGSLERGDIEEAMNAAAAIGDDTLQRNAGGTVRPDSFTHGTSEQRMSWFLRGYDSGDIGRCDTFRARNL